MNRSKTRISCDNSVEKFSFIINSEIKDGKLLYVGIAGDPIGGDYSPLFKDRFDISTFDKDPVWNPDLVGDITKTKFEDESWDCVLCVQVIEHIPNIWELPDELYRILKVGGYAIVDCPWNYPYHPEAPSFGDFWRVSKDGMNELFKNKFTIIELDMDEYNVSILIKKEK